MKLDTYIGCIHSITCKSIRYISKCVILQQNSTSPFPSHYPVFWTFAKRSNNPSVLFFRRSQNVPTIPPSGFPDVNKFF